MTLILLAAAIVFAVWAALVDAGHIDVGSAFQLLAVSLACGWASQLPWPRRLR